MATKMTKTQAIATIAEKVDLKKKEVANIMDVIFTLAMSEVKKNGQFILGDFGKLVKVKRSARMGRNPATGESIKIPAKTVIKFRIAKAVKDTLAK